MDTRIAKTKHVTGYNRGVPEKIAVVELVWDDLSIAPDQWLKSDEAQAFRLMFEAALLDGLVLRVNSAWRSFEHQERLYKDYERKLAWWLDHPASTRGARPLSPARPGRSNHHNGIAVDIQRSHGQDADGDGVNDIDQWLAANAERFGFFRTVQKELWHWEYRPKA